jgi:hypothetical protein
MILTSASQAVQYGSAGDLLNGAGSLLKKTKTAHEGSQNLTALISCLILPWLLFVVVFYARAMWLHYDYPWLSILLIGWCFVIVLIIGATTYGACTGKERRTDPNIFALLFVSCLLAWGAAFTAGNTIYTWYTRIHFDLMKLNTYPSLDPAISTGQQYMDAGIIDFNTDTELNLQKSMGFKNEKVYCVAPIMKKGSSVDQQFTVDFWAVGINCCSGQTNDFQCGEYNNADAHSGLRLLRDDQRDYFRLAVQKAEAEYGLRAHHPVFFYWLQNPTDEVDALWQSAWNLFAKGIFYYFCVQLLIVAVGGIVLSKL